MVQKMFDSGYHVEVDEVDRNEWSELLTHFQDATIHQTWSSGEVHSGEKNLSHLILKKDGDVAAMAQVTIRKVPLLNAGIATIYRGPTWRRSDKQCNTETLSRMVNALRNEYALNRGLLLRIWPNEIRGSENGIVPIFENHGFKINTSVPPYRTLLLDLSLPMEELRRNLGRTWRHHLNHAEKSNLNLREGSSNELYMTFLILLKETVARKGFIPRVDYHKYQWIQNDLPEFLKMKIMICESQGKPVSAVICSAMGDTGIYLFGATGDLGLKLNGSNLLHWCMIEWLKRKGCRWYDLGGIDPEGNPGTYEFKHGIAGNAGRDETHIGQLYVYNTARGYFLSILIDKLRSLRGTMKEQVYQIQSELLRKD